MVGGHMTIINNAEGSQPKNDISLCGRIDGVSFEWFLIQSYVYYERSFSSQAIAKDYDNGSLKWDSITRIIIPDWAPRNIFVIEQDIQNDIHAHERDSKSNLERYL